MPDHEDAGLDDDTDVDLDEYGDDFELPPAHPDFRRAFPAAFYDDESEEFAPFGSDEGWDAMVEIVEDFTPLDQRVTLRELAEEVLELDDEEFEDTDLDATEDSDFALIGAGFAILRLTGRIDAEGRQWLIDAVGRHRARYGEDVEELQRMAADLAALPTES